MCARVIMCCHLVTVQQTSEDMLLLSDSLGEILDTLSQVTDNTHPQTFPSHIPPFLPLMQNDITAKASKNRQHFFILTSMKFKLIPNLGIIGMVLNDMTTMHAMVNFSAFSDTSSVHILYASRIPLSWH